MIKGLVNCNIQVSSRHQIKEQNHTTKSKVFPISPYQFNAGISTQNWNVNSIFCIIKGCVKKQYNLPKVKLYLSSCIEQTYKQTNKHQHKITVLSFLKEVPTTIPF